MQTRKLGDSDLHLTPLGFGSWAAGGGGWEYGWGPQDDAESVAAIQRALDLGVNWIDTAAVYGLGHSEEVVAKALQGRGRRPYVFTKCSMVWGPDRRIGFSLRAESVRQECEASLRRLRVDAIDLYQIHWPNPVFPLRPQLDGMRTLVDEGVVANVGVSNFGADRWAQADAYLGRPVLSNQVHFSLLYRKPDRANVPYAQANDRIVIAYSPLEMGVLGGKYSADNPPPGVARGRSPLCLPENLARAEPLLETLRRVAAAHDATPAQVALAWLIRKPNVVAIPGASSVDQLRHNAAAADLDLTDDEAAELTAASDAFTPVSGVDTAKGFVRRRRGA